MVVHARLAQSDLTQMLHKELVWETITMSPQPKPLHQLFHQPN